MNTALLPRRDFLRAGALGGLSLAQTLRTQHPCAAGSRRDVNGIFLFQSGGMSHLDLWDLKPQAPAGIRGDFAPIDTAVPGIQVSELLPRIARITDKLAIFRGMTHDETEHGRGVHRMTTVQRLGAEALFGRQNSRRPPSGGVTAARLDSVGAALPTYISVPDSVGCGFPGCGALAGDFHNWARPLGDFSERAGPRMASAAVTEAFDISREPESRRLEYGSTGTGQSFLAARRLVEAGCRFVSVENGHWDTHCRSTYSLRELLAPSLDQALSALLNDLSRRGLLDSTLVVVATEFGRSPWINPLAGREHWPNAFSIVLAGAGVQPGQVIGATDRHGAGVADRPITPRDMEATIRQILGIDPAAIRHSPLGRPVAHADRGEPVYEAMA